MSETLNTPESTTPQQNLYEQAEQWQQESQLQADIDFFNKSSEAAQQYVEIDTTEQSENEPKDKKYSGKNVAYGVAAGASITAAAVFGGPAVVEHFDAPTFSEETVEYTAVPEDTLYKIAGEINGVNEIDIRDAVEHIKVNPANIDVLTDGLDAGDKIVVPIEVKQ